MFSIHLTYFEQKGLFLTHISHYFLVSTVSSAYYYDVLYQLYENTYPRLKIYGNRCEMSKSITYEARPPVATRCYQRPHEGARGPVGSVDDDVLRDSLIPDGIGILGGEELGVRSVVERRAFNCII